MIIGIDAHNLEGQRTGVGRYLINLLQQWNKFDLPLDLKFILYFKKEIPEDLELGSRFEKKILQSLFGWQSNAFFIHFLLSRAAKRDKVDILFCPGYVAPLFYHGRIVLTLHDIIYQARPDLYNWPSIWDRLLLKKVSKISARKAKIIFTPSQFSKKEVLKYYQVAADKIFVTPLAADESFSQIDDKNKLKEIKKKYKIKDKFIFFIGSIFNRRHLPEAIKAFEQVVSKLPQYQFLIIGTNYTSSLLESKGVLRKEYIVPKDLPLLYNAADLLVWLSDYEGFGLPILEAMACGTPVITSPVVSIPEVAGQAVIYVQDSSDVDEIAKTIERGLTDQQFRQNLISQGLEQAKKFSWQRCARKTLDALLL